MFAALCRTRCAAVIAAVAVSFGGFAAAAQAKPHHQHHRRHRSHTVRAAAVQGPAQTAAQPAGSSEATPATANATCQYADSTVSQATRAQLTLAVDCLINEQRLAHGLPEMTVSQKLNTSAQGWNDTMIQTNFFGHGTDSQFEARINAVNYDWQEAGENIASGFQTPRDAVAAWMASPEHCTNVLNPDYRDMGTGETASPVSSVASDGGTWTQDFGLNANQNPLSHNTAPESGCPYTIPSSPQG
jgi:uncharacterized protein YkwD